MAPLIGSTTDLRGNNLRMIPVPNRCPRGAVIDATNRDSKVQQAKDLGWLRHGGNAYQDPVSTESSNLVEQRARTGPILGYEIIGEQLHDLNLHLTIYRNWQL